MQVAATTSSAVFANPTIRFQGFNVDISLSKSKRERGEGEGEGTNFFDTLTYDVGAFEQ